MIASFIPQEALFPPQLRVKLSLQDFPLIRKAWGDVSMEELFAALSYDKHKSRTINQFIFLTR